MADGATISPLRVEGLIRRFGTRTAVDGLSFAVRAGEAYGLLGPNGAGKTTTIRAVAGVAAGDGGRVTVFGDDLFGPSGDRARARIGYVPQEIALFVRVSRRVRPVGRVRP